MMSAIGHELRVHGHLRASRHWFERAIDWFRSRPAEERPRTAHRQQLASALLGIDRADEAEALFRELAAEDPENVAFQGVLGVLAAKRSNAAEAERISEWLVTARRPYRSVDQLLWRACIVAHLGELDRALSLLREAAGRGGRLHHTDFCLDPLRDDRPFLEFTRPNG